MTRNLLLEGKVAAPCSRIGGAEPGSGETPDTGRGEGESQNWAAEDEASDLGWWAPVWGGSHLSCGLLGMVQASLGREKIQG